MGSRGSMQNQMEGQLKGDYGLYTCTSVYCRENSRMMLLDSFYDSSVMYKYVGSVVGPLSPVLLFFCGWGGRVSSYR